MEEHAAVSEQATHTPDDSGDLERWLTRFAEIAPIEHLRELRKYLPAADRDTQRWVLVELIKLDMSACYERAEAPKRRIEDYVRELPGWFIPATIPLDLVLEEIQLRRENGDAVNTTEYAARYPRLGDSLKQLPLGQETIAPAVKPRPITAWQVGHCIDDFVILRPLGKGAFAHVYLARQESMQRLVALKASQRSGDEPRALAQLQHPNIVRVYDHRRLADPDVHLLYMQYVPGGTLADVLERARQEAPEHRHGGLVLQAVDMALLQAAQPAPEASPIRRWLASASWTSTVAWVGIQLSRALDDAHRQGVLHRDVKPANVLMSAEGIPKLADFNVSATGLAGRAGAAAHFGGSLAYMSPEQLRVADVRDPTQATALDGRSDLYSLGVLLWEMWQLQRPWQSPTNIASWSDALEAQRELRRQPPCHPTTDDAAATRVLRHILEQTLALDPAARPSDGAELAGRLRLALFPAVAKRFDPPRQTFAGVLLRGSPLLIAALIILLPNALAAVFNYVYNERFIVEKYPAMVAAAGDPAGSLWDRMSYFERLASVVNCIAFPTAAVLLVAFMRPLQRGLAAAAAGRPAEEASLHATWRIGFQAATIGAAFWALAGIVYPVALKMGYPEFTAHDCAHFFVSLVMCGLVAWAYPFFGLTTLATLVYYPRIMQPVMKDAAFESRAAWADRTCSCFLLIAAGIPLLGAALVLTSQQRNEHLVTFAAVIATAIGLVAAFSAYQAIRNGLEDVAVVLSPDRPSPVPMPEARER